MFQPLKTFLSTIIFLYVNHITCAQVEKISESSMRGPFSRTTSINNGILYYVDESGSLWRTDGSSSGTYEVFHIEPDIFGENLAYELKAVNDKVLFKSGTELFSTNGTINGTVKIADTRELLQPVGEVIYDSNYYYLGRNLDYKSLQLIKTDGTKGGTIIYNSQFSDSSLYYSNQELHYINDKYLVTAGSKPGTIDKLIAVDISKNSSSVIADISGKCNFNALGKNQTLFLTSNVTGIENNLKIKLWSTNGSLDSTKVIKEFSGEYRSNYIIMKGENHLILFLPTLNSSYELWITDGTTEGTELIDQIVIPEPLQTLISKNNLFYISTNSKNFQLVKLNLLNKEKEVLRSTERSISNLIPFRDHVIFKESDIFNSVILKLYDTSSVAIPVKELSGETGPFHPTNDFVFFWQNSEEFGFEPWVTDGTSEGTHIIKDVHPGSVGSVSKNNALNSNLNSIAFNNKFVFNLYDSINNKTELWSTSTLITAISTSETEAPDEFAFYPSPAGNTIHLLNLQDKIKDLKIYNSEGVLMVDKSDPEQTIDIRHLPNGLYQLRIQRTNNLKNYKLIVAR